MKSRPEIFISYSHKDKIWKDRLQAHLALLERNGVLTTWTDDRVPDGTNWQQEIQESLENAEVAILLISPDFLASAFVQEGELPVLLRHHQRGELQLLPVVVRPSLWEKVPSLAALQTLQTVNEGRPLSELSEHAIDSVLADLAKYLLERVTTRRGQAETARTASLFVSHVRLRELRAFKDLRVDLRTSAGRPRSRTLIIGRNGTCKTTLLRALALSLCDPVDAGALIAEPIGSLVAEGVETAESEVVLTNRTGDPIDFLLRQEIWFSDGKDSIRDVDSQRPNPSPFVCAYGAGRFGVGTDTGRDYRIRDSVATLFDYRQPLIDSELTLRRLQDFLGTRSFEETLRGIKRVLGLTEDDQILLPRGGGVEITGPTVGRRSRLEGAADGYRLTLAWLLDLYGWAMRADRVTPGGGIEGILLIDEIEQHLHPSMQTQVLPRLAEILPDLQIFATTHSPLVALGVAPEELLSLRREKGQVIAEPVPDFSTYSAEDVLVDERLFGTSPYGPETSRKLARYQELVRIPAVSRSAEQTGELKVLARELRGEQLPEVQGGPAA